jgi:hypothetical protein
MFFIAEPGCFEELGRVDADYECIIIIAWLWFRSSLLCLCPSLVHLTTWFAIMQAHAWRESVSVDCAWPAPARTATWHGSFSGSSKEGKCQVVTKAKVTRWSPYGEKEWVQCKETQVFHL